MKKKTGVSLNVLMTGKLLGYFIRRSGYTIREIQRELMLSCPQPVYRWMNGQTMPSIDNLYKLSKILKVPMEELVLTEQDIAWDRIIGENPGEGKRLTAYYRMYGRIYQKRKR